MTNNYGDLLARIPEYIKSCSIDNDNYVIDYEYIEGPSTPEKSSTVTDRVDVVVFVRNKTTNGGRKEMIPILKVPRITSQGCKIDGTFYSALSLNVRAPGWYIHQVSVNSGGKQLGLEFKPSRGKSLRIINGYGEMIVKIGKSSRYVPIGVFLKAITGLTYRELFFKLGGTNKFVMSSLNKEPSRDECVQTVLDALTGNQNNFPGEYKFIELERRLHTKQFMDCSSAKSRTIHDTLFSSRALNRELAKDLTYKENGEEINIPRGTNLTAEILNSIDNSDVDTLFVYYGSKMFELKKYKIPEDKDLSPEELFTVVNMIACAFSGYPSEHDPYELDNRRTITYNDSVLNEIGKRLTKISESVSAVFSSSGEEADVMRIKFFKPDVDSFMNELKTADKRAETADTTNWLAAQSKESKVVTDYNGRGSSSMISVKTSETGFYDPYVQPEGSNIGMVSCKTLTSRIDENGVNTTPCIRIEDGVPVSLEPEYLTPSQRTNNFVAPWDEDITKEKVKCYYKGRLVTKDRKYVTYQEYSSLNNFSIQTGNITFLENLSGKRVTMGGNHTKQGQLAVKTSRNLVSTGVAGLTAQDALVTAETILSEYYTEHYNIIDMSYEDFITKRIKLIDTDMSNVGYRDLIFEVDGYDSRVNHLIPYCTRTTTNSVTQHNIRSSEGFYYQGKDIVAYPNSFDIEEYDLECHDDFGYNTPEDKSVYNLDLALGNPFKIGYKTYSSCNMDDSIGISSALLGTNKLARIMLHDVKYTLKNGTDFEERFGLLKAGSKDFLENGLPKVGTMLNPKEVVIRKYVVKKGVKSADPIRLDAVTEGIVIQAKIDGKNALVTIASLEEIDVGDKLTGNHGNKGVIGKIIPESYMPFTEDGEPLDMTLNPLGLPSRMNISQLLEGLLGYAMIKEGKISGTKRAIIISPQHKKSRDIVREHIEKNNITPEYLRDGRTGVLFDRPSTVAYLYMKTLSHTAKTMFNATGITEVIDPSTLQAKKGKKVGGGQKTGEMEVWALSSGGAWNILQEHFSVQSDDVLSRKNLETYMKTGDEKSLKNINNQNDTYIQAISRSLCVNMGNDADGNYVAEFMTDRDICKLATKPMPNHKDELHNPEIFGSTQNPKLTAESKHKWSYIDLKCEIIHPNWVVNSIIPNLVIINIVNINKKTLVQNKPKETGLTSKYIHDILDSKAFLAISGGKIFYHTDDSLAGFDWMSGMKAVTEAFKFSSFSTAKRFYSNLKENSSKDEDKFSAAEKLSSIESFEKRGLTPKDFIIKHLPIMPQAFRLPPGDRSSDADQYYKLIISAIENGNIGRENLVYKKISAFVGLNESWGFSGDKSVKNLKQMFADKSGMRSTILSKIEMLSSRSVIVPAEAGTIKLGEVGFPFRAAVEKYWGFLAPKLQAKYPILESKSEYDKELMRNFMIAIANQDLTSLSNQLDLSVYSDAELAHREIRSLIYDFMLTRAEDVGRQPTLHKYGIRTCVPRIVYDRAMHIHPLLGQGYNCDYDGDQMHAESLITETSIREGKSKMSPAQDFINPKDGSFILAPVQDILLGCYLATMLFENQLSIEGDDRYNSDSIIYYNSIENIKLDLEYGVIKYQNLVGYKHTNGKFYLSTAGRILFNNTMPGGFTDEPFSNPIHLDIKSKDRIFDLKFDGLIRKKSEDYSKIKNKLMKGDSKDLVAFKMQDVTTYLCNEVKDGNKVCEAMDEIFKFGVTACDKSGITLFIDDFIEHDEIDDLISKSNKIIDNVNEEYALGLLTEEDRKETSIKIYNHITNYIERTLLSKYPRNNNLFIIMDSGARGNVGQLMQTCGLIGVIKKNNKETLETPVLSNYLRGVSSADQISISFGTRNGFATVSNDTADSGEATRISVYTLSNFKIVERDCGCDFKDFDVIYTDSLTSCRFKEDRKEIDISNILGEYISLEDENYDKLLSIGGATVTSKTIYYIKKHKITTVLLERGELQLKYKISNFFRDIAINRLAKDLKFLSGGLDSTGVITKSTLDSIEMLGLKKIKMRTMLSCESVGGVCAKCYGIRLDTKKYPKVGDMIGVEAAQATGESAVQANMDQVNNGGKGSDTTVVNTYKALCNGSLPSNVVKSIFSEQSGYVSVNDVGRKNAIIKFKNTGKSYQADKNLICVVDGEYVEMGEKLTLGMSNVNSIRKPDRNVELRTRQIELLRTFNSLFSDGGVYISIRNFECLVRAQTSLVRIIESNNPEVPEGSVQFLAKVEKLEDPSIVYSSGVENINTVINMYAGFLTNISQREMFKSIASTATIPWRQMNKSSSFIGKLTIGENIVQGRPKILIQPDYVNLDTLESAHNFDVLSEESITLEKVDVPNDFSYTELGEDLFADLLSDSTEPTKEVATDSLIKSESFSVDNNDMDDIISEAGEIDFSDDLYDEMQTEILPEIVEHETDNKMKESYSFTNR